MDSISKTITYRWLKQIIIVFAMLGNVGAKAEVYDPKAAENAAFVRIFSESPKTMGHVLIGGKKPPVNRTTGLSAYILLEEGSHKTEGLLNLENIEVKAKQYYTILKTKDGYTFVEDGQLQRKTKAMVQVYNLSSQSDLQLKTADGKVTILDNIQSKHPISRQLNSVKIPLAIYANGKITTNIGQVQFKRGRILNIFISENLGRTYVDQSQVNTRL